MYFLAIPGEFTDWEEDANLVYPGKRVSSLWRPFLERFLERPVPKGFYDVVPDLEPIPKSTDAAASVPTTQASGGVGMTLRSLQSCRLLIGKIGVVNSALEKWIKTHARIWSAYNLLHKDCRLIDARLVQYLSSTWLEHDTAAQKLLEQVKLKRRRWLEFKSRLTLEEDVQRTIQSPHGGHHPRGMGKLRGYETEEGAQKMAQLKKDYRRMEVLASRVKNDVCSLYAAQGELYAEILDSNPEFFTVEDAGPAGINLERTKGEWDIHNGTVFKLRVEKMLGGRSNVSDPTWSLPARP
ncbi:hypothetical protein AYO20_07880 [Fonsecaea nubica]|uniref:Uncharacterized protein n=1 Tax=Fonsecaea nubica TaxID=856822 RepID=A0A178CRT6_9EURO|nr:hypothetical protein AYO20_07880 [Fonsecaea nubica]OAL32570.1 hypothetical protein AYO20_07880 [Fonsecaea nubica]